MKTFYLFLLLLTCTGTVFAQSDTIKDPTVPKQITTSLAKTHPYAKQVTWTRTDGTYIASYEENNAKLWSTYDNEGKLLENKWRISEADLPSSAKSYIKDNKISSVEDYYKKTNARGIVSYSIYSGGKEFAFDTDGKFINTVEKKN